MNMVYLYLQQIMMRYSNNMVITWKEALYIISRHFKFSNNINKHLRKDMRKIIERNIIKEMCRLKLLKEIKHKGRTSGFRKLKIINPEKSYNIDKGVLADILTVGKNS